MAGRLPENLRGLTRWGPGERGEKKKTRKKKDGQIFSGGRELGRRPAAGDLRELQLQPTLSLCLSRLDFCSVCPVSTAVRFAGRRGTAQKKTTTNNNSAHSCTFILQPQLTNHSTAFRLKKSQQYSEPSPPTTEIPNHPLFAYFIAAVYYKLYCFKYDISVASFHPLYK